VAHTVNHNIKSPYKTQKEKHKKKNTKRKEERLFFFEIKLIRFFIHTYINTMAVFHTKTFTKYDDWMTPSSAWEDIKEYIPNKVLWEAFYGNGESGTHLSKLHFNVIHQDIDFFPELRQINFTVPLTTRLTIR